ncbi:MAG: hypothetical protein NTZ06_02650 [Actinobacteria bacterium]|nr:hypothetical protein [Actinomycetota bacterium]
MGGRNGFVGFGAMHSFDKYFLCIYPQVEIKQINHLIVDTMVLNDLHEYANNPAENMWMSPRVLDFIRKCDLHANTAIVERAWTHEKDTAKPISDYLKPKPNTIAENSEVIDFIKNSSNADFQAFKDEKISVQDIPKVTKFRNKESLAFGLDAFDYMSIVSQNWLGIALLFLHEKSLPAKLSGQESEKEQKEIVLAQVDAYKKWQSHVRTYGNGITFELRLLANLCFFGGHIKGIRSDKIDFAKMAKKDEWAKTSKSRIARNMAFDFQHLNNARQYRMGWLNNSISIKRHFTAVLTRDNVLASMVGSIAEEGLVHGKGIHAPYLWPIDSDFTKVFDPSVAYNGFFGPSRSSYDLVDSLDLVPFLAEILPELDSN